MSAEREDIARRAEIRPIGPDDLADVRSLHATAFRLLAGHAFTEKEVAAFATHVYSLAYTAALSEALQCGHLLGAWIGGELVGTAGWSAADTGGTTARIRWIFVRPLFNGLGVGTKLLREIEARAAREGFQTLTIEATANTLDFFSSHGYAITSQGVRALPDSQGLPVAFMRKPAGERTGARSPSGGAGEEA